MMNKKGFGYTEIVYILVNIMFFSMLAFFISKSASGAYIYEETYSKQIALMIDSAEPGMTLIMDISDGLKIAEKNKKNADEIFTINNKTKEITVNLDKKGGYSFYFLSDYNVNLNVDGNNLNIIIK